MKNNNEKNKHKKCWDRLLKQLLNGETIFINYVNLEQNLAYPLMKLLRRNIILETSKRIRLKPIENK